MYLHDTDESRSLRVRRALTRLVPMVLGLAALGLLEAGPSTKWLNVVAEPQREATRLIVFFVDSLARRDVETHGAMPKLEARLRRPALHGPVQECADAITVPCMLAAISGVDHLSVFALGRNFAGSSGAIEHSVLGVLERHGHRVGYYGDRMLAGPMQGLSRVDGRGLKDAETLRHALDELARERLDMAIIHLRTLDETAHAHTAQSPEYASALRATDAAIDRAIGSLRKTDHVLVMGDHGHALSGRHAVGLEANTYAACFGPRCARALERPMAITDIGALWGRIFGLKGSARSWVDDYFEGRAVSVPEALPPLDTGEGVALWAALACAALALFVAFEPAAIWRALHARHGRRVLGVVLALVWAVGFGSAWLALRAAAWSSRSTVVLSALAVTVLTGAVGAVLMARFASDELSAAPVWERRYGAAFAGAFVLALPTVYWHGGAHVVESWLYVGLLGLAIAAARAGERLRVMGLVALLALAASLYPAKLANYVLRNFTVYSRYVGRGSIAVVVVAFVAALILAGVFARRRALAASCAALGLMAAALVGHVPDTWLILPCVAALPLTLLALRVRSALPWALLVVPAALWFSFEQRATDLAPVAVVLLLWATVPSSFARASAMVRALVVATLLWLSFWTTMGCRITGVSFDFYFRFLPHGAEVTSQWLPQTLLTTAKYLLPGAFGALLASSRGALSARVLFEATVLVRARLAVTLVLLAALRVAHPHAGTFVVGDITQDAAFAVLLLLIIAVLTASFRDAPATQRHPSLPEPEPEPEPDLAPR